MKTTLDAHPLFQPLTDEELVTPSFPLLLLVFDCCVSINESLSCLYDMHIVVFYKIINELRRIFLVEYVIVRVIMTCLLGNRSL
jgi:hypothetical protein